MTVRELIKNLQDHDQDALVWVPSNEDGKNGTVQFVAKVPHLDVDIPGIAISDDVALLPGVMEHYVCESDDIDERQGDS